MSNNIDKILSVLKATRGNGQSFDVIFHCIGGQVKIQSLILVAASNFWKNLLLGNPDITSVNIILPDIERNSLESILSVMYDGFALNRRNILSDAETIFPDLNLNIDEAEPSELTNTFPKSNEPSEMNDRTCSFCFTFFARKEFCLNHMERMHKDKDNFHFCEICTGRFKTKEALTKHTKMKHSPEEPEVYKCKTCEKCYGYESSLRRHVRIHNHQYSATSTPIKPGDKKCTICGKVVGRLSFHMEKHHDSEHQTFPCKRCDSKFDRQDVLYRHIEKVHSTFNLNLPAAIKKLKVNEKEWKCKMCEQTFYSEFDIENHLIKRNCLKSDKIMKHICPYCTTTYKEKHNLTKHINNKHSVKANITCSKCGKGFQQKSSLTRHSKICVTI
jgi:hypothetical protein